MDLDALPAVIGGHHRLNTGADRAYVPLGMDVAQLTLRSAVVPPVHPVGGTAVADEVLGGRDDMTRVQKRRTAHHTRSEEHTSELQSLAYLVCRLLLEKKKTNNEINIISH